MGSTGIPVYGQPEQSSYNAPFESTCSAISCCCSPVLGLTTIRACFHRAKTFSPKPRRPYRMLSGLSWDDFASLPPVAGEKRDFQAEDFDRQGSDKGSWRIRVQISVRWSCYCSVLMERNRHPVEITAGQSFGKVHYTKLKSHNWCKQTGSPVPVTGRGYHPVTVRRILPCIHRLPLSGLIPTLTKECPNTAAPRMASAHRALHM